MAFKMAGWSPFTKDDKNVASNPNKRNPENKKKVNPSTIGKQKKRPASHGAMTATTREEYQPQTAIDPGKYKPDHLTQEQFDKIEARRFKKKDKAIKKGWQPGSTTSINPITGKEFVDKSDGKKDKYGNPLHEFKHGKK